MIKHRLLLLVSLWFLVSCQEASGISEESTRLRLEMDSLFQQHQYFQLRKVFKEKQQLLEEKDRLLIAAKLKAIFNERRESEGFIQELLNEYSESMTETDRVDLLKTQINNRVFLFDYTGAAEIIKKLLKADSLSRKDKKDYSNTLILLESLQQTTEQTISLQKDELPITKDLAGLSRIPVTLNSVKQGVIFDTGANFSVITDSLALHAGIEIIGKPFKVKAITGVEVDSRIAVADTLKVGKTILHNVVFLVVPEASLSFPQANYTINAILGFPVITALKELIFVNEEKLIITGGSINPETSNLALDFLTPVVEVLERGRSLPFTFDTGATNTALYKDYFQLRKNEIMEFGRRDSLHFGGAGGNIKIPVYFHTFAGRIGNSTFKLDSVAIHEEDVRDMPGIYGNLGQDVLNQFDTLVIDFEDMGFMLK